MPVSHLELLVEEPSMKAFLEELLPRLLSACTFQIHAFQSKSDLRRKIERRLRAYARQPGAELAVVVLVDRDRDACLELKAELEEAAARAGLATRSKPRQGGVLVINRIVVEELEAWYFGDWAAVRAAYPKVAAGVPRKAKYRVPDEISDAWEALEELLQAAGYFAGGLPKVEVARRMGRVMNANRNCSASFRAFLSALPRAAA